MKGNWPHLLESPDERDLKIETKGDDPPRVIFMWWVSKKERHEFEAR